MAAPLSILLAAGLVAAAPASAQQAGAQDPNAMRWRDTAELSYVLTEGNAQTQTLGFKNKLWREWERSAFELNAGAVRAESTIKFAVGDPNSFDIEEESSLTAESYYLNGRFDRKITDRFFWFVGAGWDKNTFSGIDNRYAGVAGLGNIWADRETLKFRTDYAVTFTKQDDVIDDPDFDDSFLGARFSWGYLHRFGLNTTYTNDLILDDNLDETSDFRANMINAVAVSMSSRLALKVSLQWLYDHQPAFGQFELFDPVTGASTGTTVMEELDELDTIVTASLVVNF